ncbi:aldo/keto reductase [Leifsonia poae]|uniref:aldo/keto reductase n=1 Tax=Leifsonia poae TaxID=110933 RepID=UPI001CBC6E1C|nr:aldo/keto reductase [Leifsonia poae]
MSGLILGTATFGAGYGIMNTTGRLSDDGVREILRVATSAGVDLIDTAPDYGDAQARLGALSGSGERPDYVSKFGLAAHTDFSESDALFRAGLDDLRVSNLYGLLFHRVADLRDPRAGDAWDSLRRARVDGLVERIGASVYDADDLDVLVERFPDISLLQIPGSIVDRRLLDHPALRRLHDGGTEIHVRSAYLQGLLLSPVDALPVGFDGLAAAVRRIGTIAEETGTTAVGVCLGFLAAHPLVDRVLVGATTAAELTGTVTAWREAPDLAGLEVPPVDEALLDPRTWPPREDKR